MAGRPQILLIKPVVPYPPDQGTRIVSLQMIQTLQTKYDVTVLARVLDDAEERAAVELKRFCHRVVTVPAPNLKSFAHRAGYKLWYTLKSVSARRSLKSLYDCPGVFLQKARELAVNDYDLVIVEYWQLFEMLKIFPADKTVLLTHDIDLLVNRQKALLEKRVFKKVAAVRRWMMEQREEVRAYLAAARIMALTERDAAAARKLSKDRAVVDIMPFGMDPNRYEAPEDVQRSSNEVLFMGAMSAAFNADAIEYFVSRIYPHLDDVDADYTVVGGGLPSSISFFGTYDRVEVVGRVDDVRRCLWRAACMVIPMRFGGGLRIRILEAMMAGLPVICTTTAIAGMDFEPDRDYLLADNPEEFAGQIRRLLAAAGLRHELAANARQRAIALYGLETQSARLLGLIQEYVKK